MDIQLETKQAIALYKNGDKQQAVQRLRSLAANSPDDKYILWALANASPNLKEKHHALDRLLKLAPNNENAQQLKQRLPALVKEPEFVSRIPQTTFSADTQQHPAVQGAIAPVQPTISADTQQHPAVQGAIAPVQPSIISDTQQHPAVRVAAPPVQATVSANTQQHPAIRSTSAPVIQGRPTPSGASAITALVILAGAAAVGGVGLWQLSINDPLQSILGVINSIMGLVQAYMALRVFGRIPGATGRAYSFLKGTTGWCVLMMIQLGAMQGVYGSRAQIDIGGSLMIYGIWLVLDLAGQGMISMNRDNLIAFDTEVKKFVDSAKVIAQRQVQKEHYVKSHQVEPFKNGRFKFHNKLYPHQGEWLLYAQQGVNFGGVMGPHIGHALFTNQRLILLGSYSEVDWVMGQVVKFGLDHEVWSPDATALPADCAYILDSTFLVVPYTALGQIERTAGDMRFSFRDSSGRVQEWKYKLNIPLRKQKETDKLNQVLGAIRQGTTASLQATNHKYYPVR